MNNKENEIKRLNFEDILWLIFIMLSILNIVCNQYQKDYVTTNNEFYEHKANKISIFVLSILLLVYIYFFTRNCNMYNNKDNPTKEDLIKVTGSAFFIIGTLCLLYFQTKSENNFIDSPEL